MKFQSRRTGRTVLRNAVGLFAATAALGFSACGDDDDDDDATGSNGTTKVTYAYGFSPAWSEGWAVAAQAEGYYEEEGLDVEFVVPDSTQTAAQLIGTGRADAGYQQGLDPIAAVDEGIPLKVAFSHAYQDIGLITLPDGPQTVSDLEGETVGVFASLVYDDVCRGRLLEENGLSEDDIETQDTGFNAIPPLLTKRVAATEGGGNPAERLTAELETGEPTGFFSYGEVCPINPIASVFSTEWAEQNPDAARAFVEASLKGVQFAIENPEETKEYLEAEYPESEFDLIKYEEAAADFYCAGPNGEQGLGVNDQASWEELIGVAVEGGAINEELLYEDVVTDEYLPEDPVNPCESVG